MEDVGVLVRRAVDDRAVAGDQPHADDVAGDAAEIAGRAVRRGRDGAGDRLAVDVAEVGHRQAAAVQLLVQAMELDAGLDGDLALDGVRLQDALVVVELHEAPVGQSDRREGVAAADDLHPLSRGRRITHDLGELLLRCEGESMRAGAHSWFPAQFFHESQRVCAGRDVLVAMTCAKR